MVLKGHSSECTAIVANEGYLISTGKDNKITIHTAKGGQFEYIRQIALSVQYQASSIDYLGGKILIGHDNGRIVTVDLEGKSQSLISTTIHDGEAWGLEVVPENGTFLACGDDNEFHEFSMSERRVIRSGKIWSNDYNNGNPYTTQKIRSTASSMSSHPSHMQGRAIAFSRPHGHVAVSNNQGDILIFQYGDFSKLITILVHPKEWNEVMDYSPDGKFFAVGSHDDCVYIYAVSAQGQYKLHYHAQYIHSSAVTGLDWTRDSRYLRAVD